MKLIINHEFWLRLALVCQLVTEWLQSQEVSADKVIRKLRYWYGMGFLGHTWLVIFPFLIPFPTLWMNGFIVMSGLFGLRSVKKQRDEPVKLMEDLRAFKAQWLELVKDIQLKADSYPAT